MDNTADPTSVVPVDSLQHASGSRAHATLPGAQGGEFASENPPECSEAASNIASMGLGSQCNNLGRVDSVYDSQRDEGGMEEYDEDEYEDPEEIIREFGKHPMMDRVQEALYNQLLQTYERVSEELRDKEAEAKK